MKIGVITFHRAYNYGSALQAFALNHYLNQHGYEAEVIDFHTSKQDNLYKIFDNVRSFKSIIRNMLSLVKYNELKMKKERFDEFVKGKIILSDESYNETSELSVLNTIYDLFICGSDQIWNTSCMDFSTVNLLDFVDNKSKCISYAASVGISEIPTEYEAIFSGLLKDYKAISVREKKAVDIVERLTGRDAAVVPDPVLLLNRDNWLEIASSPLVKGKYILCYFIGNVSGMREFAVKMHKKTKLPLVVINRNIRDLMYINKKLYSAGPREFLALIRDADYVCTDSFHAIMFSLIFHKNFWVFAKKGADSSKSRIENILDVIDLRERMLDEVSVNKVDCTEPVDYAGGAEI